MAARAIATLSLSFGLVSIPVKLYSATESSSAIRFKLMGSGGRRLTQQYVSDNAFVADDSDDESIEAPAHATEPPIPSPAMKSKTEAGAKASSIPTRDPAPATSATPMPARSSARTEPALPRYEPQTEPQTSGPVVVERHEMMKGYEFERGKFVLFAPAELKALREASRDSIDIVSFIPEGSVDPVYFDKAYLLAPDKRGEKTYSLLLAAMRESGRCALAKWAWRAKEYVVQIRPAENGMVLQQLFYADEVRSLDELDIKLVDVGRPELDLALRLIAQISEEGYDPSRFVDEEKQRILAAVEAKIAGRQIIAREQPDVPSAHVIDLIDALRASLVRPVESPAAAVPPKKEPAAPRKPAHRAAGTTDAATPKARARK